MSWVTAVWSIVMGGCGAIALPHLLIPIRQRRAVHCILLAAIAEMATAELAMLHAQSAEQLSKGPEVFRFQWKMASDTHGMGDSSESATEKDS
jgi:hypothetical protein